MISKSKILILILNILSVHASQYESRYFRHGSQLNERDGGTCAEFLEINRMDMCCMQRDDDCFMIHHDTRCYCDVFCNREVMNDYSDCCPDAVQACATNTNLTKEEKSFCYKDGLYFSEGDVFMDNCNQCHCKKNNLECSRNSCLYNPFLVAEINSLNSTWKAGNYSAMWGKTLESGYKQKLGTKIPRRKQRSLDVEDELDIQSYDFRDEEYIKTGLKKLTIKDQGNCAASWAFSAIDVLNDRTSKMYNGTQGDENDMSVQMVISCIILPRNANGCSPATVDSAWNYIEKLHNSNSLTSSGLVTDDCYPFESADGLASKCKVNSYFNSRITCPSGKPYKKVLISSSSPYQLTVESANDIMEEIYNNGPVQVVFKVYEDFFMYKSGIYQRHPRANVLDVADPYHSVKLLGWGTENNVDYWIASNSWGEDWGENGYFRIIRDDRDTEFGRHVYAVYGSRPINTKNKNTNRLKASRLSKQVRRRLKNNHRRE